MTIQHPNLELLSKLDLRNLDSSAELFTEKFVWHYFNPNLPDLEGDYAGIDGVKEFFKAVGEKTDATFKVEPVSATPVGDELVVVHVRDTLVLDGKAIALDVVVVWRIVDNKFAEAWDIPSAFALANE